VSVFHDPVLAFEPKLESRRIVCNGHLALALGEADCDWIGSLCIMENDANGVTHPGAQAADAVSEIDAVGPFRSLNRPIVHGESHCIALPQWHHLDPALHAWALFRQDKLAAREVLPRFREKDRDLKWKCEVAVEILMQTVEVAWNVLEQEWCRTRLRTMKFALRRSSSIKRRRIAAN
jgi:hypothetical protein